MTRWMAKWSFVPMLWLARLLDERLVCVTAAQVTAEHCISLLGRWLCHATESAISRRRPQFRNTSLLSMHRLRRFQPTHY
jgi:hypothetical protein